MLHTLAKVAGLVLAGAGVWLALGDQPRAEPEMQWPAPPLKMCRRTVPLANGELATVSSTCPR